MNEQLIEIFRHNRWANLRLFDWCAGLDDDLLDASAPGTYGTAGSTLVHLVGAEERYIEYLTGELMPDERRLDPDGPFPGLAALRERVSASGECLVELAASTPDAHVLVGTRLDGTPYRIRATTLLVQAIHHAAEHRTHVMTVISQHGIDAPETDGWLYGEEVLDPA
jgi:uncharacterized damage-inducible protein DinB